MLAIASVPALKSGPEIALKAREFAEKARYRPAFRRILPV
tara:strand:- start:449 stop:568 length:120 start_codon:yes stop_codon:yes gene_type:complete